jgi:hypothetical protein
MILLGLHEQIRVQTSGRTERVGPETRTATHKHLRQCARFLRSVGQMHAEPRRPQPRVALEPLDHALDRTRARIGIVVEE